MVKVLSKQEMDAKGDLLYLELDSGFHLALDFSYIDQVGDFKIELPTGEIINTKDFK